MQAWLSGNELIVESLMIALLMIMLQIMLGYDVERILTQAEAGQDRDGHSSTLHNDRCRFERGHVHLTTAKAADPVRPLMGSNPVVRIAS
jgi:hypothetical protein